MKKNAVAIILACLISLAGCTSGPAKSTTKLQPVSLQLQWITQAQFAGYYVALDKGWYREEGLDLTIKPGSPDLDTVNEVATGNSDFGTAFLTDVAVAIQKGKPVVSIAQIQQMSGLLLISKKDSNIRRPSDLVGKRIGMWGPSWESQLNALLARERIARYNVRVISQGFNMEQLLTGDIDVASAMVYNEYHQLLEAGMKIQELNIIDYTLYGLGFPGDILFTGRKMTQQDPELCLKVLRASLRGWTYAIENSKEAVDIVLKYDKNGTAGKDHQISMMREISRLVKVPWCEIGYTDSTAIKQMVTILNRYKVLAQAVPPESIYTNEFWEKLQKK
jgi:NitT/TauT family transport system substrate-binding protein